MKRHARNPIVARSDIPAVSPRVADVSSVFNPAAFELDGRYQLLLRVQTRGRETVTMPAVSDDGVAFTVEPRLLPIDGLDIERLGIFHVYDLRATAIEGRVHVVFAADTADGCRLGVARLEDDRLELLGFDDRNDSRNGVLFPEKIGGRYLRLERPNRTRLESGVKSGDEIWLAESDDLVDWSPVAPVMKGRPHYWDELIGSGPPPVKTSEGWLHLYHGVATHFASSNIYQAGVCLLDLDDPSRVVARSRNNILEPREPYELTGQVPNVVFPTGMIVEGERVRVYYGAADSCVALAETTVGALIDASRLP
jgi:beta-1,4-mannooligosaccharide/beta-1,4-mannosyl-N-acetylglucosamine phosphorylase